MVGRLTRVNSTFSMMPIFAMCTLKIPITIINTIDLRLKRREYAHVWSLVAKGRHKMATELLIFVYRSLTLQSPRNLSYLDPEQNELNTPTGSTF